MLLTKELMALRPFTTGRAGLGQSKRASQVDSASLASRGKLARSVRLSVDGDQSFRLGRPPSRTPGLYAKVMDATSKLLSLRRLIEINTPDVHIADRTFEARAEEAAMHASDLSYQVEETEDGWTVSFCHEHNGKFRRRIDAIRSAVLDANRVRHIGHRVTISIARPLGAETLPIRNLHLAD